MWTILYSCPGNFYPRSPCGERHNINSSVNTADQISIHALLAESDCNADCNYRSGHRYFYPRSPCGERRLELFLYYQGNKISIHALLAESDSIPGGGHISKANFYPRSPCGERQRYPAILGNVEVISIHALLAESDLAARWALLTLIFLSTLSLRRATRPKHEY